MIAVVLGTIRRVHLVLVMLALTLVVTEPALRRYGDKLQIALPMIAWACAATDGKGTELFLRFAAVFTVAHGTKIALGDAPINQRPNGRGEGFPSAHTAAAAFGASSLASDCLKGHPVGQAVSILAAAFVGGSRIEARAHDLIQVMAGALLGWGGERLLRRDCGLRRRIVARLQAVKASALRYLGRRFGLQLA